MRISNIRPILVYTVILSLSVYAVFLFSEPSTFESYNTQNNPTADDIDAHSYNMRATTTNETKQQLPNPAPTTSTEGILIFVAAIVWLLIEMAFLAKRLYESWQETIRDIVFFHLFSFNF